MLTDSYRGIEIRAYAKPYPGSAKYRGQYSLTEHKGYETRLLVSTEDVLKKGTNDPAMYGDASEALNAALTDAKRKIDSILESGSLA